MYVYIHVALQSNQVGTRYVCVFPHETKEHRKEVKRNARPEIVLAKEPHPNPLYPKYILALLKFTSFYLDLLLLHTYNKLLWY